MRWLVALHWLRKTLAVAGLVLIGHQSALIPHALCKSLEETSGEAIEVASLDATETHCLHNGDEGLSAANHGHHHEHCDHQLLDSRQVSPEKNLIASIPLHWTLTTADLIPEREPAIVLVTTSRNQATASSTEQFVRHVRLLS